MTPEERAVKWFEKVPETDDLSFDQRLAICKKDRKYHGTCLLCSLFA